MYFSSFVLDIAVSHRDLRMEAFAGFQSGYLSENYRCVALLQGIDRTRFGCIAIACRKMIKKIFDCIEA